MFSFSFVSFGFSYLAIDLQLDGSDIKASQSNNEVEHLSAAAGLQQQQTRKLCCPDCDGGKFDFCYVVIVLNV